MSTHLDFTDFLFVMLSFQYPSVRYDEKGEDGLNWAILINTPTGPLAMRVHDRNAKWFEHIPVVEELPKAFEPALVRASKLEDLIEHCQKNTPVTATWVKQYVREHINEQAEERGVLVLRDLESAVKETEVVK